jgi:6-phosphogluconolactonase
VVANAKDGTVSGDSIVAGSGVLTPVPGSPFAIPAAALTTNPIGSILYASSPAGILAFSINPRTGALTPLAGSPFAGPGAMVLTFVL